MARKPLNSGGWGKCFSLKKGSFLKQYLKTRKCLHFFKNALYLQFRVATAFFVRTYCINLNYLFIERIVMFY